MDSKHAAVIEKIVLLCKQNSEVKAELCRRLSIETNNKLSNTDNQRLKNIEQYLALDFAIDSKAPSIDFSFVTDENVRLQLIADNREMYRYRYGTRSHKIDFSEFCKYAHFQLEALVNYRFIKAFGDDMAAIKDNIIKYNGSHSSEKDFNFGLLGIPCRTKFMTIINEYKDLKNKVSLFNLYNVIIERNNINHRAGKNEHFDIDNFIKTLASNGLHVSSQGFLKSGEIDQHPELKDDYKKYKSALFRHNSPYNNIISELSQFADIVKNLL